MFMPGLLQPMAGRGETVTGILKDSVLSSELSHSHDESPSPISSLLCRQNSSSSWYSTWNSGKENEQVRSSLSSISMCSVWASWREEEYRLVEATVFCWMMELSDLFSNWSSETWTLLQGWIFSEKSAAMRNTSPGNTVFVPLPPCCFKITLQMWLTSRTLYTLHTSLSSCRYPISVYISCGVERAVSDGTDETAYATALENLGRNGEGVLFDAETPDPEKWRGKWI